MVLTNTYKQMRDSRDFHQDVAPVIELVFLKLVADNRILKKTNWKRQQLSDWLNRGTLFEFTICD